MFKQNVLSQYCLYIAVCFMASTASAALITMEIDSSSAVSDYDLSRSGNELKIDYIVSNTTQSENSDDALYRILIPAGINQSIYSVHVPDHWIALVRSDDIELYTLNGYEAIQCGESKSFSIYARNTGKGQAQIRAMTTLGDWAIPATEFVPNGQIPEPATLILLAGGICLMRRKN